MKDYMATDSWGYLRTNRPSGSTCCLATSSWRLVFIFIATTPG